MTDLLVAPCDHKAARWAVEHWHYSRTLSTGKIVRHGVWEDDTFMGVVLYAWGANHNLASQFGLAMIQCAELVRVALRDGHVSPVSQIIPRSVSMLRESSPGLRLVVSFADPHQGHHGGIYQAMNWLYLGTTGTKRELVSRHGRILNRRAYTGRQFGQPNSRAEIPTRAKWIRVPGKHRYAMPLDKAMRRQLTPRALPYPHAVEGSEVSRPAPGG